jgi:ABC-type spermidine/putrescine transport system permease subunit II
MWTVLALFVLWIASMYFYLPLPVVIVLFAALASGTAVAVWFGLSQRRLESVAEQDSNR